MGGKGIKKEEKKVEDPRAAPARENGKLGGRPRSEATLRTLAARDYISKELQKNLVPIVAQAIRDAIDPNDAKARKDAREWLGDRGWGKAVQAVVMADEDGLATPITEEERATVNNVLQRILEGDISDS